MQSLLLKYDDHLHSKHALYGRMYFLNTCVLLMVMASVMLAIVIVMSFNGIVSSVFLHTLSIILSCPCYLIC